MAWFLSRLRGGLGLGIFAGITWAVVGLAIGTVVLLIDPASIDPGESPPWMAYYFGRAGFVAVVPQAMLPVFVVLGAATISGALALAKRGDRVALSAEATRPPELRTPAV
jgi:hypothetical protein